MGVNNTPMDQNSETANVVTPEPQTTPQPVSNPPESNKNTSTIVTIILLLLTYPVGVIVMWFWPKWSKLAKILVSLPIILGILGGLAFVIFMVVAPNKKVTVLNNGIPANVPVENSNQRNPFGKLVRPQESSQGSEGIQKDSSQAECEFDSDCSVGKCVMRKTGPDVCSEGKLGQACFLSLDCETKHCGAGKCTNGQAGDPCDNLMGCESSLDCKNDICQ